MLVAAAAYYAAQQDTLTSKEILKLHAMFPKELTAVLFLMSLKQTDNSIFAVNKQSLLHILY